MIYKKTPKKAPISHARGGTDKIFNSIPTVASKNSTCSFCYLSLTTQNHAWRR